MAETFPDYLPSKGSAPRTRIRVLEKTFGDGYVQTAADGLNAATRSYRAIFDTRLNAEIAEIVTFLTAHGGVTPFLFTVPGDAAPRRWRCKEFSGPTWVSATYSSLTATFIEDYGLS